MKKKSKAFSFVEVMTSVFLVSVGLLAALSLLTKGLRETMDSRDQVIASFLAQEGVELVRNIRDNNWVNGNPTFQGIDSGDYQIDYNNSSLSNGGSFRLKFQNGFYHHGAGTKTKFFRKISIIDSGDEKDILSMVVWNGKDAPDTFKNASGSQDLNESNCNVVNECAYTKDKITSWGG